MGISDIIHRLLVGPFADGGWYLGVLTGLPPAATNETYGIAL